MVLLVQCSDERVELCAFKGYPHGDPIGICILNYLSYNLFEIWFVFKITMLQKFHWHTRYWLISF